MRKPPSDGPTAGASVEAMLTSTMGPMRFSGGNSMNSAAMVVGIMPPPRKPWMVRNTSSDGRLQAMAHIRLAKAKPTALITK